MLTMLVLWNSIREVGPAALEILASEMRPTNTFNTLTLINAFMMYSMRGPVSAQNLMNLWAIETANLLVWMFGTVTLHFAGLL
jgi:hypothetical protein